MVISGRKQRRNKKFVSSLICLRPINRAGLPQDDDDHEEEDDDDDVGNDDDDDDGDDNDDDAKFPPSFQVLASSPSRGGDVRVCLL